MIPLFRSHYEEVVLQRWAPGTQLTSHHHPSGEEIYLISGELSDQQGNYSSGSWLRQPASSGHAPVNKTGCTLYMKTGHLSHTPTA